MAEKTISPQKTKKSGTQVRIVVKHDCGFNNYLAIRGSGAKGSGSGDAPLSLNWNKGIPLKNTSSDEWVFECESPNQSCEFKILINDELYEFGNNHVLNPGKTNYIYPNF